jgi:hypothetical protein
MTARDTIAAVLANAPRADAVLEAIRGMSHDELRELRPDIATLYDTTRYTSDARAAYILALTTRAHTTTGRPVTIHLTIQDDAEDQTERPPTPRTHHHTPTHLDHTMTTNGLKFAPKTHRYTLDGQWVPGVTTLIGKGLPKPQLMYWSAKTVAEWVADHPGLADQMAEAGGRNPFVAFLKAVPWQKRDDAAVRGTDVHALAEKLVHGEAVDVPEHLTGYVSGYVDWLDRFQPEALWTERPVANRRWHYAGTFDLIANLMGETWLLDVKTASGVYGDNAIQLAAYKGAEFLVDHDGSEIPMPHIDRLGILHVQDGETQLYPVKPEDGEAAWKDFLHIAWVANAEKRIKSYIGDPIPEPTTHTTGAAA